MSPNMRASMGRSGFMTSPSPGAVHSRPALTRSGALAPCDRCAPYPARRPPARERRAGARLCVPRETPGGDHLLRRRPMPMSARQRRRARAHDRDNHHRLERRCDRDPDPVLARSPPTVDGRVHDRGRHRPPSAPALNTVPARSGEPRSLVRPCQLDNGPGTGKVAITGRGGGSERLMTLIKELAP